MSDIVRVVRVIEYVGPREKVEKQLAGSMHGTKDYGNGVRISVATIGDFAEILEQQQVLAVRPEAVKTQLEEEWNIKTK